MYCQVFEGLPFIIPGQFDSRRCLTFHRYVSYGTSEERFWFFLLLLIKSLKGKKCSHGGQLKQRAAYMKQILSRGKERAFLFGSGLFSLASGMAVGNVAKLIRQSVQHFGPG